MATLNVLWLGTLGVLVGGLAIDRYVTHRQFENLEQRYAALLQAAATRSADEGNPRQRSESLVQATNLAPAALQPASAPVASESQAQPSAAAPEAEPPSPQDQAAYIDGVFTSERNDHTWARDAENNLNGALSPFVAGGSRIQHVECHSTLCKVRVEHATETGFRDFARHLAQPGYWRGAMISVREPEGTRGTVANVMYFSREGYALPNMPD